MRVPTIRLQLTMLHNLNRSAGRMERSQIELATGKRILAPSDDPAGAAQIEKLNELIAENNQYQTNSEEALRWLAATEEPLISSLDLLMRLEELVVRAASDSSEDHTAIGNVAAQILEELLDESKARVDDRYVFSGFNIFEAPYEKSTEVSGETFTAPAPGMAVHLDNARIVEGSVVVTPGGGSTPLVEGIDYEIDHALGSISAIEGGGLAEGSRFEATYETDTTAAVVAAVDFSGAVHREVERGRPVKVNILGSEAFTGTTDVFEVVVELKNAFWRNDREAVRAMVDDLEAAQSQVRAALGEVGAAAERVEKRQVALESSEGTLRESLSAVRDADYAELVARLQSEEIAYQAALSATSRISRLHLHQVL